MIESKELEEFVRSACQSIQNGISEGLQLHGCIEFEVAVVNQWKAQGGIKILIVGASGNYAKEEVTKIKFKIGAKERAIEADHVNAKW